MRNDDYCVIVDAYSTGNQMAKHFKEYGFEVIHVQSSKIISSVFEPSFRRKEFEINIIHNGNLIETLEQIKQYNPKHIVPGAETGVELANELAKELYLLRNDDDKVHARRNKFIMNELIREEKLPAVEQLKTNDSEKAIDWALDLNKWPVVVKPLHSAASDGVAFCYNENELKDAFNKIVNIENSLGILNDEVLVQRYLEGPHYVVNAMTHEGKHFITDIWRHDFFKGNGTTVIYDKIQLMPYDRKHYYEMTKYVEDIITILGIQYGPTHTEVRLTNEGPRLVEVNCRTMGLSLKEEVISDALSYSHSSLAVDCYANPKKLLETLQNQENYCIKKYVSVVFLNSQQEGVIESIDGIDFVKGLLSFADIQLSKNVGDHLYKTTNVETHPGFVILTSTSKEQIENDYLELRRLEESEGFFKTKMLVKK
ncbi:MULTISPECIES: ATP-grasp domain-containing protein [Bacillus]|uniref:ATP-grasp domain-containing protein n=2 Tax=Bacillus cereus group TaxID=86661 RepID=A0A9W5KWZ0_BACCE|nr:MULTISPECIES: ATP-grasp domain-containing protein [Bacillus cereus group]EJR71544.1 hypothetical protein IK5_03010 [Bacillus cereus VD154]KIU74692.1 ArgH2 [Bacillus thuringiensis Sbt003]MDZ4652098.1 ATP-grasp domain-containing protein [Bacillus cereus]MEB2588744.1 ATP-grasp domain-containing protein [Bacillus cereus]MEB2615400.1 ATP-grasp domain-containing protein [Bacillus cereus]